jgi:hypothetical protein
MSAAVVPGAKLLAWTTKGPAVPRIVRPCPGSGRFCVVGKTLACCALLMADAILFVRAICEAAEVGREGGLVLPKGLFLCCLTFVLEDERYR